MERSLILVGTCALVGMTIALCGCRSDEATNTHVTPPSIAPSHEESTPFGLGGGPKTDTHGVRPRMLWYGIPMRCALPAGARHRAPWCDELDRQPNGGSS